MIVGITGGIGAGKSLVARYFGKRGAIIVDADKIGHRVLEMAVVKERLKAVFGGDILKRDGKVDRRRLGRRAFVNEDVYGELNRIVQPPLSTALHDEVAAATSSGAKVVVVEAPVLFEWGNIEAFDVIVVVDAAEGCRVERIVKQGRLSCEEIKTRMAFQLPAEYKREMADHVIANNGTTEDLEERVEALWTQLLGDVAEIKT